MLVLLDNGDLDLVYWTVAQFALGWAGLGGGLENWELRLGFRC